ncbi:hypothetical protein ACVGOW_14025 [Pseudonocardia saturnea]
MTGDPSELVRRLREATEQVMSGWTGARPVPPATLSARQLQAVLDDLAARRAQVQALQAQLGLFDEQLATLETSLGPLLEWAKTWAGVEGAVTDLWRLPGSGKG